LIVAKACPSVILANAVATCAAVAPEVPAVNVRPFIITVSPDVRAENVTEADSDTPETPDVVVMVGLLVLFCLHLASLDFHPALRKPGSDLR
jgi:hypothetical protein